MLHKRRDSGLEEDEEPSSSTDSVNITGKLPYKSYTPPTITIKELRAAVPPHCFERSTLRSLGYVIHDIVILGVLVVLATFIDTLPGVLPYLLWPVYWFAAGVPGTGLWVTAHECGHGAFSDSTTVNSIVGYVIHSCLLVPYYSWKYSHQKHHKNTNSMEKDQVFVPSVRSKYPRAQQDDDVETPLLTTLYLLRMLVIGWPAYLLLNVSGQDYGRWTSHFDPSSPIFDKKSYWQIVKSDIGVLAMIAVLTWFSYSFGFMTMIKYYFVPYLWVNAWLVIITYLQHSDEKVPHYNSKAWTFARGALSTIDRDYGILNYFFHEIGNTHVAHHLFSTIPHYHAKEATKAIRAVLGEYYTYDRTPIVKALWKSYNRCKFVEDEGDVLFYSSL